MEEKYEVFSISGHYVLHASSRSLWCSKLDGGIVPSNSSALDVSLDPVCLGTCYGIVGKIQFLPESPDNLVLITDKEYICDLHQGKVHRINDIVMLPLSLETPYLELPSCPDHPKPPKGEKTTETDAKIERKLEEEFIKWFERSFYYCEGGDITRSLTELTEQQHTNSKPTWQSAKNHYFWNEHMLECLISVYPQYPELCDPWIIPVMQGYVEQREVCSTESDSAVSAPNATLTVISRRNKHRAGTRFKRRGIDDEGCPANFVETEQILSLGKQQISYTIIRGSVPVYWYQPLTNYRPKPVILRTPDEALDAFRIHMDALLESHKRIVVVNLLDGAGKEAPLGVEFAKVACMYNNENLTYIAFDFNEYCAGMKFDNVNILLKELTPITDKYAFTHVVAGEVKTRQEGAVRVNCMDSLDRTNVVQGAIARATLNNQALSLNIPLENLVEPGKLLWANNGDAISTQYAGTAALKGDYTRTGERGVAGMMRDGVSSVTRMYINVFRDTNRQAAIDIMQGLEPDISEIREEKSEELDCIPGLLEQGASFLPSSSDTNDQHIYKAWIAQEWPSGAARGVWLTPKTLSIVSPPGTVESLPLSTCDRIHIGQPPDCLGHYMRIINGRVNTTVRPLTDDTSLLKDHLMKMAHAIVSCRDDLGLSTQVLHGPLSKSDIMDLGIDKLRSSANSFGTKLAAGAKRMIGEARGVLDTKTADSGEGSTPSTSPRASPKFGKKMFSIFRRDEQVDPPPAVRLSDLEDQAASQHCETDSCTPLSEVRAARSDPDIQLTLLEISESAGKSRSATIDCLDGSWRKSKSNFIFFEPLPLTAD